MIRKILVVDDNEMNRKLLCKILSNEYAVLEACNGKEALKTLKYTHDELSAVLLDIIMPEIDGYEVLRLMSEDDNLSQIPVIVTTGSTEEGAEVKVLSLGAKDYVVKPYNPTVIKHRLYNTIRLRETAAFINASRKDKLTGLYNREGFFEKAEELINLHEAGYYVMACFDIDNFKVINDQYGIEKGDEVLKYLAEIFEEGFGRVGGVCCRIMADNFAVLYPRFFMESEEIEEIRNKATLLDGSIIPITFSIGRYPVDDKTVSVSAMYDRASIAEMSVKSRFDIHIAQYEESMREHILREQEIINDMKSALQAQQFEVWFQPQYNHSTSALIGAEALVRWRHPQKGLISPGLFIPVFEKNGFIYELDKYVWEQTCIYLKKWKESGRFSLPISVNISRYDIFKSDLVDVLVGLIEKYQIPVDLLRLEITESAFSQSTGQIIRITKQLMDYGFTLEIDDFGSGYSSLNTLKDVQADILKLDMRFLESTENSARGGNILESIVRMAKWLGMAVIAEGVEEREQADYLQSIGCHYIQGYYYAKPMPAAEFEKQAFEIIKEEKLITLETVETLNNNVFWDPKSMDTLVFNTYVGGANVFEYYKGEVEILRANTKYAEILGGKKYTTEEAMKISWKGHIVENDRLKIRNAIKQAIETGDEITCEAAFINLLGDNKTTYLKAIMRVIAHVGERHLFYCMIENLTKQKEAEKKTIETTEQLKFLNETAHDILTQIDVEKAIESVLSGTMKYFGANRAYVIELDYTNKVFNNTYEVCATGIESEKDNLQKIPFSATPFWLSAFDKEKYICIENVDDLKKDREEEKQILKEQGIQSLIAVPFKREEKLLGFIGVDDPSRRHSHTEQLKVIGDYISAILMRRNLNSKIDSDKISLLNLMNDTPGGFSRIRLYTDNTAKTVFVNNRFCELRGMTQEEVMRQESVDALSGVHPDDIKKVKNEVREMVATGESRRLKYRLRHSNGGYIWFKAYGRISADESGEVYINVYYKELPEALNI